MKEYKTEIAIIIGAIIISITLFFSVTHDKRKAFNYCMELTEYFKNMEKPIKRMECMFRAYNIDRRAY